MHVFFDFHEKSMDFLAKNEHFSNFDKITGNDRIQLLYSSKDQEFANELRNKCQKPVFNPEHMKLEKKSQGYKNDQKLFFHLRLN